MLKYPDYNNCIANLSCSIMKYFGAEAPNNTLVAADLLLQKEYKNVVVILLDGMGVSTIEKHLKPDGFFRRNMRCAYSSTFPPTTVAATTAMDSGLMPNQSAWIGWVGYFRQIDKNVVYYWNVDADTGRPVEGMNAPRTFVPYKSIREHLADVEIDAHYLASYVPPFFKSYGDICESIRKLCAEGKRKYIYAYWEDPDDTMHKNGVDAEKVQKVLAEMEAQTEQLALELSDTLLIITADHGHVNVENDVITDYPDICECLVRMPSIEIRSLNLFVKPEKKEQFEEAFNRHFGEKFILMTKEEVMERQLFGTGKNHEQFGSMIGDYLAIAVSNVGINNEKAKFKGHHAGMTEDEMTIPLIAVDLS